MGLMDWLTGVRPSRGVGRSLSWVCSSFDALPRALQSEVDPNRPCSHGTTPLVAAICARRPDVVDLLLASGADPNVPSWITSSSDQNAVAAVRAAVIASGRPWLASHAFEELRQPLTPLVAAAKIGAPAAVTRLLEAGARLEQPSFEGMTPLQWAATADLATVQTLVAAGASLDAICTQTSESDTFPGTHYGFTALAFAVLRRRADVVRFLAARGATVDVPLALGATPLAIAAMNGDADCVSALFAAGARLDPHSGGLLLPGIGRTTTLHLGVWAGNDEVVSALLAHGADPEARDGRGLTPWQGFARPPPPNQ